MLNEFMFTKIEDKDIGNIWYQEDGATCNTAEATLDVLRPVLKTALSAAELMSFGHLRADYYIWSVAKDKCYVDKAETIEALKDNIREALVKYSCIQSIMSLKIDPVV